MPPLSVLVKPASADCNLACPYCFYSCKRKLYPETTRHAMSDAVLETMIKQVMPLGWPEVSFGWQGGEPTLMGLDFYKKALEFQIKYAQSRQTISNSLQTNAVLLDESWMGFLSKYQFLIGVSLDGPKEVHDHYRVNAAGQGSYDRVMSRIRLLRRWDVEFNILTLLNSRNAVLGAELYRFFVSQGFEYLQFIPCIERGSTGEPAPYTLLPEVYGRFLCETFDEWIRPGRPNIFVRLFDAFVITMVTGDYPYCGFAPECGSYVVIEHNGDVYPCDFFVEREWLLGNIMQTPLEQILASPKMQEFRNLKKRLAPECGQCEWLNLCNGGCLKERMTFSGKPDTLNYYCKAYKQFFAHSKNGFARLKDMVLKEEHEALEPEPEPPLHTPLIIFPTGSRRVGRNDPCPCGSGKKYKKCCGASM